jgi:hypothetical protein
MAMKFHLVCPDQDVGDRLSLVFDWDEDTGTVTSDDPDTVASITWGLDDLPRYVGHIGWQHKLSDEPLKSRADMAAIIASLECVVPDVLKPYFKPEDVPSPATEVAEDGSIVRIDY